MPEPTSHTPLPQRYVFVYGTLRAGDDNDITLLRPAPRFVGTADIAGTLYHLGRYPGVLLQGEGRVQGEVYAITPELELKLDTIESLYPEKTDEYVKREIRLRCQGLVLTCLTYEINPRYTRGRPVIESGDWVRDR